eukprot:Nk52_evm1s89 gene=Nk52_evmTU1s89
MAPLPEVVPDAGYDDGVYEGASDDLEYGAQKSNSGGDSNSLSTETIIIVVVCVVVFGALLVALAVWVVIRRKRREKMEEEQLRMGLPEDPTVPKKKKTRQEKIEEQQNFEELDAMYAGRHDNFLAYEASKQLEHIEDDFPAKDDNEPVLDHDYQEYDDLKTETEVYARKGSSKQEEKGNGKSEPKKSCVCNYEDEQYVCDAEGQEGMVYSLGVERKKDCRSKKDKKIGEKAAFGSTKNENGKGSNDNKKGKKSKDVASSVVLMENGKKYIISEYDVKDNQEKKGKCSRKNSPKNERSSKKNAARNEVTEPQSPRASSKKTKSNDKKVRTDSTLPSKSSRQGKKPSMNDEDEVYACSDNEY